MNRMLFVLVVGIVWLTFVATAALLLFAAAYIVAPNELEPIRQWIGGER